MEISNANWLNADDDTLSKCLASLLEQCQGKVEVDVDRLARCAISNARGSICRELLWLYGARSKSQDTLGMSLACYAAASYDSQTSLEAVINMSIERLMTPEDLSRQLNHKNVDSRTALHYARAPASAHLCLLHGADVTVYRDDRGRSFVEACDEKAIPVLHTQLSVQLDVPIFFEAIVFNGRTTSDYEKLATICANDHRIAIR